MAATSSVLAILPLALLLLRLSDAQTPIPFRPLGFVYQTSSTPKVVVEAFYDHLCPDSKANWPILKEVFSNYAKMDVTGLVHIFPLPYHHNAYFVQQAGVVVRQVDPHHFIQYMELVFDNLGVFTTGAVNNTEPEVQNLIATFINTYLGVDKQKVLAGFTDEQVTIDARYAWKYAASRTISGTPIFIINGVVDPNASGYSEQDWHNLLDELLKQPMPL